MAVRIDADLHFRMFFLYYTTFLRPCKIIDRKIKILYNGAKNYHLRIEVETVFKILVVEDDRDLRELFCAVLTDNGYTAIEAADGLSALELLENSAADLAVLDVMLPGMNGYELTKNLREAGINIPILMITARQSLADKREGFKAGTDDYMVKPVDVDEMVWRIEALLRRSQAASQRKIRLWGKTILRSTIDSIIKAVFQLVAQTTSIAFRIALTT